MKKQLSSKLFETLVDIINKRNPKLLQAPFFSGQIGLTEEEREMLREALADEFCEFGLKENDEPNEYGILVDDLISKLGEF